MKTQPSPRTVCATFALALGIAAVSAASAQQAPAPRAVDPDFQSMDANQDGHLVRSEISHDMKLLRIRFTTYDTNQDGFLDPQEFSLAKAALQGGGHAGSSETPPAPKPHSSANPGG